LGGQKLKEKGETLKELGKFLYNLSLLIIGALILQPLTKGKLFLPLFIGGVLSIIVFVGVATYLIYKGEQYKSKEG
jgi:hypothetical protein